MKICFVDAMNWTYAVDEPLQRPLGGSQSAACYLAMELAKRGHDVSLLNGNPDPITKHGVVCRSKHALDTPATLNAFDVVIVINGAFGKYIRDQHRLSPKVPLILWQHAGEWQPEAKKLHHDHPFFDAFAFVAEWQRERFEHAYGIEARRSVVMHNCVGRPFERIPIPEAWYRRSAPPTLFYTPTPFRGLDVLLDAFPLIREKVDAARLEVYSSMDVYKAEGEKYADLYRLAKATENVTYVGSLDQIDLAMKLKGSAALAHPSTFPECHSIALIEAMAVGADVYTTDFGGQAEALAGLAPMMPYDPDKRAFTKAYADFVIERLRKTEANPDKADEERARRIRYIHDNCLWRSRAKEWEDWLADLVESKRHAKTVVSIPKKPDGKHVLIAIISGSSQVEFEATSSVHRSLIALGNSGWKSGGIFRHGEADLPRQRNAILAEFLANPEYSDLIFIDADVSWEDASAIERLLSHDVDVVAGIYPKRSDDAGFPVVYLPGAKLSTEDIIEVAGVPAGFLRIRRSCAERMVEAYSERWYEDDMVSTNMAWNVFEFGLWGHKRAGEDIHFCLLWRALGGKVYADPAIALKHHGTKVFAARFADDVKARMQEEKANAAA